MKDIKELLNKLKKLMIDQKETPEGELAKSIFDRLKEKYPNIDEIEDKEIGWEYLFENMDEFVLWQASAKAHNIIIIRYNIKYWRKMHIISKGNEVDMIIAKAEWEHAKKEYERLKTQLMRAIVNKLWSQICKKSKVRPTEEEDGLCGNMMGFVNSSRKQIED